MEYYVFGNQPAIASYTMTIGSFKTRREARKAKRRYKKAGWSKLYIKKMDWL